MKILLLILVMLAFLGGILALMFFIIKKMDPMQGDKTEDTSTEIAQDFIPFDDIRNGMIVLPDYCYRAVIECSSLNYDLKTEGEREQIEMSFQQFINSLSYPISIFMQTKEIDNSKRIDALKKDIQNSLTEFPNLKTYAGQYLKAVENLNTTIGNSQQKKRYVIVSYDEAGGLEQLSDGEKASYASKELQNRCNAIINGLSAVGVHSRKLDTEELIKLVYSCYNRDNYSYADAISTNEAFALFVDGAEDKFKQLPRIGMLDLILGNSINQIETEGIDADPSGKAVLEQLEALRKKYAGYFKEA